VSSDDAATSAITVGRRGHLPFAQVSVAIARRPDLSVQAKALYMLLCTYADVVTRDSFPKRSTLGQDLGMTDTAGKRWVSRYSAELAEAGVLRIHPRVRKDGSQSSNYYELLDAELIHPPRPTKSDEWFHDRRIEAIQQRREDPF
jgi:hypothetical protein